MKRTLALIAILAVLLLTGWKMQRTQWEYKFESNPRERRVNELAAEGWELVAIDAGGTGIGSISTYVFKRAR